MVPMPLVQTSLQNSETVLTLSGFFFYSDFFYLNSTNRLIVVYELSVLTIANKNRCLTLNVCSTNLVYVQEEVTFIEVLKKTTRICDEMIPTTSH